MRLEYCEEHIDDVAEACGLAEKTVKEVKVGNSRRKKIKEQFPEVEAEISALSTDAVTELGKKDNLELLEKAIPIIKEKMSTTDRLTKKEIMLILAEVRGNMERDRIALTEFPIVAPEPEPEPTITVHRGGDSDIREPIQDNSHTEPVANTTTLESIAEITFSPSSSSNGQVDIAGNPVIPTPQRSNSKFNETNDNIEWAKWSWNPVTGCKFGCKYCYARDIAVRFNTEGFTPTFHPERLDAIANMKIPPTGTSIGDRNVFVCSMADLFGDWVPQEWIDATMKAISEGSPKWNYLFLTKNPSRLPKISFPANSWVGTTIDVQARVAPAEKAFKKVKATVKFVSIEPMMEPIIFDNIGVFDWIIIGGRSASTGMDAGQPEWEWVESVLLQARNAGVKIYFKPNLTVRPKEYPE